VPTISVKEVPEAAKSAISEDVATYTVIFSSAHAWSCDITLQYKVGRVADVKSIAEETAQLSGVRGPSPEVQDADVSTTPSPVP